MENATTMPVKIFCCYAREDQELLDKLKAHLMPLQLKGLISIWNDTNISPGTQWEEEIHRHLNTAQIILLLISPDFMNSDYCYGIEMKRALERHERREARVIPVLLRPVYWHAAPFGKLQALPTNAKPVVSSQWYSQDEAFLDVATGIFDIIAQTSTQQAYTQQVQVAKVELEAQLKRVQQLKWLRQHRLLVVLAISVIVGSVIGSSYFFTATHVPPINPNPTSTASFATATASVKLTRTVEVSGGPNFAATEAANSTATAQALKSKAKPLPSPYASYTGVTILNHSLTTNADRWDLGNTSSSDCQFQKNAYQVSAQKYKQCMYQGDTLSTLVYQVQMTFLTSDTCGGIIFGEYTFPTLAYSEFHLCTDGTYSLAAVNPIANPLGQPLRQGQIPINTRTGQSNILGIVITESTLFLFVNGRQINSISANAQLGTIGLSVSGKNQAQVAFTDAQVCSCLD